MSIQHYKACVFGNPIEQSKSPVIHEMFAEQFQLSLEYNKRFAPENGFTESAEAFFADKLVIGANVTMPFKHDAAAWVNELSEQALRAGAVNTIIRTSNGFKGDNSDGVGLVNDLVNHGVHLKNARLLFIGAGGAAKGALPALIEAGVKSIDIYNRSKQKAIDLVKYTRAYSNIDLNVFDESVFEEKSDTYDLIINATSLSLHHKLPNLADTIFCGNPVVYDMVYQPKPTVFLQKASANKCTKVIDGLGMLVEQAAHSFYLWFGKKPDTHPVYKYLRELTLKT